MKKLIPAIVSVLVGLTLVACGGQAHAAATEDFVVGRTDGRVYSVDNAIVKSIEQNSASGYTITYTDNTTQALPDTSGGQFTAIKTIPSFAAKYVSVLDFSTGNAIYVSVKTARQLTCAGSYLTINSVTYNDAGCTAYAAFKAAAVQ